MSKTRLTYILKTISSNKIPFVVLLLFSCIATMLYTAIGWSGISMEKSIYGFCEDHNMYDISVTLPIGCSQDEIDRLLCVDGVDQAEGGHLSYGFFKSGDISFAAKVSSLTEVINVPLVTEGVLPKGVNEIAIEGKWAQRNGISVGDVIMIDGECDGLCESSFAVTAFIETPASASSNAIMYENMPDIGVPLDTLLFAPSEAFRDAASGGYEQVFLRSNDLRRFARNSEEYAAAAKELKEKVTSAVTDRLDELVESLKKYGLTLTDVDMTSAGFRIRTSDEAESFAVFENLLEMYSRIKYVLSLPFVIVCLAISCSVILRITSDGADVIGLQLAMGASKSQIISAYLMFTMIPSFFGAAIGTILGCVVGEAGIVKLSSSLWCFEKRISVFRVGEAFGIIAVITVLMCVTVILSSRLVLKRNAVSLINGSDVRMLKKAFYEKTRLWRKLPLLTKSIINNIRIDRVRVVITILGIMGCTVLSVSGLYMAHSINNGFIRQFDELMSYETVVYFDPDSNAEEAISKRLSEHGIGSFPIRNDVAVMSTSDGRTYPVSIFAADEGLNEWRCFYSDDGKKLEFGDGVLLSCPFAKYYDISRGSSVTVTDGGSRKYDVDIQGVFDYYLVYQQLILPLESYETLTGREVKNNIMLIAQNHLSVTETDAILRDIDGYYHTYNYKTAMYTSYTTYSNVATCMAVVLIVLSLFLALFMLLNLFVQLVNEKKRELITMMMNGYSLSFARRYIYSDTVILGTIGTVIGAAIGNIIGALNMLPVNSALSYFPRSFDILASLEGIGVSAVFITIMCLRTLRQIKSFSVLDLNKA